jgi:hypothetical protein
MKNVCKINNRHVLYSGWLYILLLCPAQICGQARNPVAYSNNCNSFIRIIGGSNINAFSFTFSTSSLPDAWQIIGTQDTGFLSVNIPVREFEPSNPLMYNDFLQLIKAHEFPLLRILIPKERLEKALKAQSTCCMEIEIMLAGVTRIYKIDCNLYDCRDNLFIEGLKRMKLSDFNIDPPVKFNGLVKVKDEIAVNFGLIITLAGESHTMASR